MWYAWVTPSAQQKSYDAAAVRISSALAEMAEAQEKGAARNLKIKLGHKPDEVVDVTVTCDCGWSKRGFTAAYGVAVVMSWESGGV